jgi:magnesium-transporting ATPase (P-type)
LFLIVVLFGILGMEFPYLPQQVTLLNLLTIGGPAFVIIFGRALPGTAVRTSFLREVGLFALTCGLIIALAGALVWLISASGYGDDAQTQRTMLLSTLVLMGLGNVLSIAERDRRLWLWVAAALPVYLLIMYLPPTGYFFELAPLSAGRWMLAFAIASTAIIGCIMTTKAMQRRAI